MAIFPGLALICLTNNAPRVCHFFEEARMRLLTLALGAILAPSGAWAQQAPVAISVDLGKTVGPYKPIYSWFGYDEANYTTMRHGTELLRQLHDLSPVPVYIRAHH